MLFIDFEGWNAVFNNDYTLQRDGLGKEFCSMSDIIQGSSNKMLVL